MARLGFVKRDPAALLLDQGFGLFDINVDPVGASGPAADRLLEFDPLGDVLNAEDILKDFDPERMAVDLFLSLIRLFPLVLKLSGCFAPLWVCHNPSRPHS